MQKWLVVLSAVLLGVTILTAKPAAEVFACGAHPDDPCHGEYASLDELKATAIKRSVVPGSSFLLALTVLFMGLTTPARAIMAPPWLARAARGALATTAVLARIPVDLLRERAAARNLRARADDAMRAQAVVEQARARQEQARAAKAGRDAEMEAVDTAFHALRARYARGEIDDVAFARMRHALAATRPAEVPRAQPPAAQQVVHVHRGLSGWDVFWIIIAAVFVIWLAKWLFGFWLIGSLFR